MIDGDTIYTLGDCSKRNLTHRHKASALWVKDCLHVDSIEPVWRDAWFEINGCSGEGSAAVSNRRVLVANHDAFLEEVSDDLRIAYPAALRWAFRRESHPLHSEAVDLVEAINALADHPVVDEYDLSNLEYEWAEEAVTQACEEACEEAISEATKDLAQVYDETDFNLEAVKDAWIRDAMASEWWAHEGKDNVRFPQMEGDTRFKDAVVKALEIWRKEFESGPDEDLCPLAAADALEEIAKLAGQKWASPAHTLEAWRSVCRIVMEA